MTIFWARWNQSIHFFTTYQTLIYIQDCFSQPPRSLHVPDLSQKLRSRTALLMHMFAASPMQDKHLPWPNTTWLKTAELLLHHPNCTKLSFPHANYMFHWSLFVWFNHITMESTNYETHITQFSPTLKPITTDGNMLWTMTKQHTMKTIREVVGFMPHLPYLQGNSFQQQLDRKVDQPRYGLNIVLKRKISAPARNWTLVASCSMHEPSQLLTNN